MQSQTQKVFLVILMTAEDTRREDFLFGTKKNKITQCLIFERKTCQFSHLLDESVTKQEKLEYGTKLRSPQSRYEGLLFSSAPMGNVMLNSISSETTVAVGRSLHTTPPDDVILAVVALPNEAILELIFISFSGLRNGGIFCFSRLGEFVSPQLEDELSSRIRFMGEAPSLKSTRVNMCVEVSDLVDWLIFRTLRE